MVDSVPRAIIRAYTPRAGSRCVWPIVRRRSARRLTAAKEAAGDRYVNILGADIARQCLEIGQLDEVLTIVAPVMLGDGTRLFGQPGGRRVQLDQMSVTTVVGAPNLCMRVVR